MDVVLQQDDENSMDRIYEQRRRIRELKTKRNFILRIIKNQLTFLEKIIKKMGWKI